MASTLVTKLEDIDRDKFSEFVHNHPKGNIFQTPEMYQVYANTECVKPILSIRKDSHGDITSSYLGYLFSEKQPLKHYLLKRVYSVGEPLAANESSQQSILEDLQNQVKRKCLYLKISNLKAPLENNYADLFRTYLFEPHLNFIVDLTLGEEQLWNNLHETRRKQIKRGYNRGIKVEVTDHINDIGLYKDILKHTYKRAGLDEDTLSFFDSSVKYLSSKKYIHFISAYFENKLIAHRAILTYKDYIYDWFAGNLDEYTQLYPNDVLVWETLKWGANNNYKTFNFGGAGHPDKPYGVREFKKKFGGQMVNFGYQTKVFKPITYKTLRLIQQALEK